MPISPGFVRLNSPSFPKKLHHKQALSTRPEVATPKWFLWHGNAFCALQVIDDLKSDLDTEDPTPHERKLYKTLAEFGHYIDATRRGSPTTESATATARRSRTRSWNPPSTRSSANAWSRNSRCAGHHEERTSCSRSEPTSSTTTSPAPSAAGTQSSCQPPTSTP